MDIDLLSKIVKEIILDKDEVSLPGLGSFIAELVFRLLGQGLYHKSSVQKTIFQTKGESSGHLSYRLLRKQ